MVSVERTTPVQETWSAYTEYLQRALPSLTAWSAYTTQIVKVGRVLFAQMITLAKRLVIRSLVSKIVPKLVQSTSALAKASTEICSAGRTAKTWRLKGSAKRRGGGMHVWMMKSTKVVGTSRGSRHAIIKARACGKRREKAMIRYRFQRWVWVTLSGYMLGASR